MNFSTGNKHYTTSCSATQIVVFCWVSTNSEEWGNVFLWVGWEWEALSESLKCRNCDRRCDRDWNQESDNNRDLNSTSRVYFIYVASLKQIYRWFLKKRKYQENKEGSLISPWLSTLLNSHLNNLAMTIKVQWSFLTFYRLHNRLMIQNINKKITVLTNISMRLWYTVRHV